MLHTVILQRIREVLLLQILLVMRSIQETWQLALLLPSFPLFFVDAKQGVLVQTRRHARICALMGIHHFVFAVNKMDLVGYSESRFNEIVKDINELSETLGLQDVVIIPVSATEVIT